MGFDPFIWAGHPTLNKPIEFEKDNEHRLYSLYFVKSFAYANNPSQSQSQSQNQNPFDALIPSSSSSISTTATAMGISAVIFDLDGTLLNTGTRIFIQLHDLFHDRIPDYFTSSLYVSWVLSFLVHELIYLHMSSFFGNIKPNQATFFEPGNCRIANVPALVFF